MTQLNILIVDDNQDLAEGLGMVLEDEGYQVALAFNGADAIESFSAGHFDMVFLDVKLPDMNGIEVFQKIHKASPKVKVIMMSGFRIEQLIAEVVEDGDVEVLRKPLENARVLELLGRIHNESIILIDNNDFDFADILSVYLNDHGVKAVLALKAQQAIKDVLSNQVDVLVLDLHMPIMCSLEVYLELQQQGHAVKTIIVTGYIDKESSDADMLRSTAGTGCLFKPFDPQEMLEAIEKIMGC